MTTRRRPDLHDLVRELTEPTQHREQYMRKRKPRYHVTVNPPLLVQLAAASTPKSSTGAGASRPAASKPSAALEATDTLLWIDHDSAAWVRRLGEDDPGNVVACVLRVGALAASQDHCGRRTPRRDDRGKVTCCTNHRIETDVRRWWTRARIVTRWDLPAWSPDNTCPLCGSRGTIRIHAVEKLASCTAEACRAAWDETTIGLLAEHIRTENGELGQAS
jgi:hypothetical protein